MADDPAKAGSEFLNRWREDLSDFIPADAIEACTDYNIYERPPQPENNYNYVAFADAAGGTGSDSFGFAICHRAGDDVVLDVLRERKPRFIPRDVISEYTGLLRSYGTSEVQGDRFGGGFHSDEWERNGIRFTPCEHTTAEVYLHSLPMLLSGRARLIDSATLRAQLAGLERRVQPGGRETVSHGQVASAHDDVATAACGALVAAGHGIGTYTLEPFQPDYVDRGRRQAAENNAPVPLAADRRLHDLLTGYVLVNSGRLP